MKKKINYSIKFFIILSIVIYGCLQIGLLGIQQYYTNQSYYKNIINTKPVGEIVSGTEIIQELPNINVIDNMDLLFATYGKDITSNIKVELIDKNSKEIFSQNVNGKEIKDNEYYRIPINVKINNNDMPLYLRIKGIDGTSGNALTIWSSDIQNQDNICYINKQNSNKTLNISINRDKVNKINEIGHKVSQGSTLAFLGIIMFFILSIIEKKSIVKKIYKYRYLVVVAMFFISVFILKINFSSLKAYEMFIPNNTSMAKEIEIGDFREIRSDEWGVLTPLQLSQEGNNYNSKSTLTGEETSISVVSGAIPAKDISAIGKPFVWGFILFGSEIGLAWYSISKILLLLIFSYKLIDVLVKDKKIATIGGFILGFSPAIQWWFSTCAQVTESIICWEIILVSLYNLFVNENNRMKYANTFMLLIGTVGFTFTLYPPIQIPLFYLGILLIIGIYMDNKDDIKLCKKNFVIMGIVAVIYIVVSGITIRSMLPEIQKIMNTVYPGKRTTSGGKLNLEYLVHYLPSFLLPYKNITYLNSSEISSFFTLFPMPLVVYFLKIKSYKTNVIKSLVTYIIFSILYMYVGLPMFISKITLMSMVTEERMYIIFGLACTILLICIAKCTNDQKDNKIVWYQIFLYIMMSYFVYKRYSMLIGYMGKWLFILIIALCLILIYFLNKNKDMFLKILLIITLLTGATINPINFGIGEIRQTEFSAAVRNINGEDPGMWVTVDDIWISKYIIAQGVQELNALNYPPMIETWEKIDKNKEYSDVYNRYAHVQVSLEENSSKKFELIQPDLFKVSISNNQVAELGIKYLASKQELKKSDGYFKLIYTDPLDHIFIYKVCK